MVRRTKTYIAADWDNDFDAVQKLHQWNDSNYWSLSFHDAHKTKQARDTSFCCSIKKSLRARIEISKRFVLIVGDKTTAVTKGSCRYCSSYLAPFHYCTRDHSTDFRSYISYECEMAIKDKVPIVVLYKSTRVNREKCPSILRNVGNHVPMYCKKPDGTLAWDYVSVKNAFN